MSKRLKDGTTWQGKSFNVWFMPQANEPRVHLAKPTKRLENGDPACKWCQADQEGESQCWCLTSAMVDIMDRAVLVHKPTKGRLVLMVEGNNG